MGVGVESVDGKIVDSDHAYAAFDKELRSVGFEINKLFVEFAVLPVIGVLRFEKDAFDPIEVEPFELRTSDRPRRRNLDHGGGSDKNIDAKIAETPAAIDHVKRDIDMSARMRSHLDGGQMNPMLLVARHVRFRGKLDRRIARPDRHGIRNRHRDVIDHERSLQPYNPSFPL